MSPDLKTSVTRAIFIFSGKVLLLRHRSKMYFNGTNKELKFCLTISQFISSKPGLLLPFKEKNVVFISSSDKITSSKELSDSLRYISNDLCDWGISHTSFGSTLTKYSLKLLTMVFWSKIFLLLRMRCFGSELLTSSPLPISSFIICQAFSCYHVLP